MISRQMGVRSCRDFCRRFGVGLGAGADLLKLLESEAKHGSAQQRVAMTKIREGAKDGHAISEMMRHQKPFFPPLMVVMTRVGETTGKLERTMLALSEHYAQQYTLRQNFLRAIAWPGLQLLIGIGVVSLMIWIMGVLTAPTGGQMTDMLGFGLRGPKGVLIFWSYIAVVVAVFGGIYFAVRKNVGGIQNVVPLVYQIPKIGGAIQTITLARFAWTLSLSLDAGINPIDSTKLSLDATDSSYYRSGAKPAEEAIRGGATLSEALNETHLFPEEFITQIEIAELSGTDAESIDRLARDYDERAKGAMQTIAGVASAVIWMGVSMFLIFMIFRIFGNIMGFYQQGFEPI